MKGLWFVLKETTHDSVQLFNEHVVGNGVCVVKRNRLHFRLGKDLSKAFNLKVEPVIYSNAEQTLSFLIDISFSTLGKGRKVFIQVRERWIWCSIYSGVLSHSDQSDVKGYELSIEIEEPADSNSSSKPKTIRSCLQIIPRPELKHARSYRLRIKDPSFGTIFKKGFSFYFGRVQVQALISCQTTDRTSDVDWEFSTDHLCQAINALSPSLDVGILNTETVDTSSFPLGKLRDRVLLEIVQNIQLSPFTDQCRADIMSQTCIKRHRNSDSSFIIMHPMPMAFDRVLASMDPISLAERAVNEKNTPLQGNSTDGQDLDLESVIFRDSIESFHYQKQPNSLVFKLVHFTKDTVLYTVSRSIVSSPCLDKS